MASTGIHPTPRELTAFAHGRLSEAATDESALHLAACADCRRIVAEAPPDPWIEILKSAWLQQPADGSTLHGNEASTLTTTVSADLLSELPAELREHPTLRVRQRLGAGGMASVYLAQHTVLDRLVAVKVIRSDRAIDAGDIARFRREMQLVASLEHPNIVRALDAQVIGELHLLVMEYLEGETLDRLVAGRGPLPMEQAAEIIRQAATGLQFAHEKGLTHRDIKPHNLLLTPDGTVKILDFGLAKLASDNPSQPGLTVHDALMGTPEYIAPEQARNTANADPRADLYSLGATLFHLLAGRAPYQGPTAMDIIVQQIHAPVPDVRELRPDLPEGLAEIATRLLAKEPADRPQTPQEVADALEPFARGDLPAARKPPGLSRRGLLGLLAAGLVLVPGIILVWRQSQAVVYLEVEPDDALVEVTGGLLQVTPAGGGRPWKIAAGADGGQLTIRREGFEVKTREITVRDRGTTMRVRLEKLPPADPFPPGSVWMGTRTYVGGIYNNITVSYDVYVEKRDGDRFSGVKYDKGPRSNGWQINGQFRDGKVSWKENNVIHLDVSGTVHDNVMTLKLERIDGENRMPFAEARLERKR